MIIYNLDPLRFRVLCYVPKQILRIMKLTIIIMTTFLLQVSAGTFAQKITLNEKNASLEHIITTIRLQSGYDFIGSAKLIKAAKPITIMVKETHLEEVLKMCFQNQDLTYSIQDKTVIVKLKDVSLFNSLDRSLSFIKITGTVTDAKGSPIPGVLITIKGKDYRSATNTQGKYVVPAADEQATLVFSMVGYLSQEVKVVGRKVINVQLVESDTKLDEVVVVGYGSVMKKDLTGSVAQANVEDMAKAPVATFDQALAGRIAGVNVTSGDGQPGSDNSIVIRGGNSLNQNNSPLYVIDGFPMEDFSSSAISPEDIASISVLKDASATAIYGARGANGVIVIETKKGTTGKPIITYNGSIGAQTVTNTMKMMSPYEFVKYQLEVSPPASKLNYLDRYGIGLDDYKGQVGLDWQNKLLRTAPMQIHNMGVRGGSTNTKYSVSGSLYNQDGVVINSNYDRYTGKISIDQIISKKIKTGFTLSMAQTHTSGAAIAQGTQGGMLGYVMYNAWAFRPTTGGLNQDDLGDEFIDDDPQTTGAFLRINPVINANEEHIRNKFSDLVGNAFLSYEIIQGLVFRASAGFNNRKSNNEYFYNSKTSRGTPLNTSNIRGVFGGTGNGESRSWLNEYTLSYNKTIKKDHKLNLLGGFTLQKNNSYRFSFEATKVPNEELGISALGSGTPYNNTSTQSLSSMLSYFGRANYSYKSKYLFTFTMRADGSSKFPPGSKWGYFPSGAIAWRFKEENFLKNNLVISDAKLRTSYGITGNNRVGDFSYLPNLVLNDTYGYSFGDAEPTKGLIYGSMGNDLLKWESTAQLDLGLDLGLFKDRIQLTFDVYQKITSDLLLSASLPRTTGFISGVKNIGKIKNQGLEFTLNTVNAKNKNFSWTTNFNIAFNRNKILELVEGQESLRTAVGWDNWYNSPLFIGRIGQPAALFYGYIWDGNYQYSDFNEYTPGVYTLKSTTTTNGSPRSSIKPGDIKYKDLNGDKVISTSDLGIIGSPIPVHIGGLSNNFNYKNFSLNVLLQWSYGNDVYNANRLIFEGNSLFRLSMNQFNSYENRWTPENQNNELYRTGGHGPLGFYNSRVVEDASFLRLKTVAFAYKLPVKWVKKLYMNSLALNLSGQNLLVWTNYKGMDPEVSIRNTPLTPGFDFSAYPRARTIVFGLNANF